MARSGTQNTPPPVWAWPVGILVGLAIGIPVFGAKGGVAFGVALGVAVALGLGVRQNRADGDGVPGDTTREDADESARG